MPRVLALALTSLLVASFVVVPSARADHGSSSDRLDTDFNATVALTLASPGQFFSDAEGNRFYQGLVFTGQISGWPVTGTLRIDANVAFQAGSSTGEIDGSYVISEGGNSFRGDLSESRVQESSSGWLIAARMNIEGGTGLFDDARGNARIAGVLPAPGLTAGSFGPGVVAPPTFGAQPYGVQSYPGQPYAYGAPWPPMQPQFGAFPSAVAPPTAGAWQQVVPTQATLAISGHIALHPSSSTNAWRSQSFSSQVPQQFQSFSGNADAQRAFRDAIRDFFNDDGNVRPGNGWGDRNHEHTGPRGNNNGNSNGNGNNRGRGRGNDKD